MTEIESDMLYQDEHHQLMSTVTAFCHDHVNPFVDEWEKEGTFPAHDLFARLAELGLLGINRPVKYGGLGLDHSFQLAFCEAMGHSQCASINLAVGVQCDLATSALARFGSDEICEQFLAPSIKGELVACLGVSEVGAGSDFANITTSARRDGSDYVINGGKMWTTNGTQADWICLLCNTGEGQSTLNKSLICVPLKTSGVTVARRLDKLGMKASDTAQIFFDEVRVPDRFRIGTENRGLLYQMHGFLEERIWASGSALIMMERIIHDTVQYASQRSVYGRTLIQNQSIQFKLAELLTEVQALRSLTYRAVEMYINGEEVTPLVCMSKLKSGRLQRIVADCCLQYYGGMGFTEGLEISRFYRDARLTSIGGGADEVMLAMIARSMGLPSSLPEGVV
jgi:citronellyl-CoA dehydrogenase